MNTAISVVLCFIAFKLIVKVMFDYEVAVSLSLGVVVVVLALGAGFSIHKQNENAAEIYREAEAGT